MGSKTLLHSGTILGISALVVAALMLCSYIVQPKILFVLLYPGEVVGLWITGGHGGTSIEEGTAIAVSFLVNTLVYTVAGLVIESVVRRWRRA